jgi:hypothetical protein
MIRTFLLLVVSLLAVACSSPPRAPHPLGAECTWPERVDRDRVAVLLSSVHVHDPANRVTLLDTETGTVVAACGGLAGGEIGTRFADSREDQRTQLPPLNTELTLALGKAGVVDLRSGATTADPTPERPIVALLSGSGVLRGTPPPRSERAPLPSDYCVADSPASGCTPLAGTGPGNPAVHPDGTVGWAPDVPVPVTLTAADGRSLTVRLQTDGTTVVQARFNDFDFSSLGAAPLTRNSGAVGPGDVRALFPDATHSAVAWYATTPLPVLYLSRLRAHTGDLWSLHVLRDGGAIGAYEVPDATSLVRIDLDGTLHEVGRIPTVDGARFTTVAIWPDPEPGKARS